MLGSRHRISSASEVDLTITGSSQSSEFSADIRYAQRLVGVLNTLPVQHPLKLFHVRSEDEVSVSSEWIYQARIWPWMQAAIQNTDLKGVPWLRGLLRCSEARAYLFLSCWPWKKLPGAQARLSFFLSAVRTSESQQGLHRVRLQRSKKGERIFFATWRQCCLPQYSRTRAARFKAANGWVKEMVQEWASRDA